MMPALSWVADAVLAVLLTATLCMSVRLDRALRVIRRDRSAFEALISNLGAATGAVKVGIEALRGEAERAAESIERRAGEADKMATDLSFLIEAADRVVVRLDHRLKPAPQQPDSYQCEPQIAAAPQAEHAAPPQAEHAPPPAEHAAAAEEISANPSAGSSTSSSGDLRELAGITTKRHARGADAATRRSVEQDRTHQDRTHADSIKLAG